MKSERRLAESEHRQHTLRCLLAVLLFHAAAALLVCTPHVTYVRGNPSPHHTMAGHAIGGDAET
jgi:hypothetical protein